MKTVIITDSTCDISKEQLDILNVEVVPLSVNFGDKSYLDGIDITKKEFFRMLAESSENPTTSQPSPESFLEVFSRHKEQGNEVVFIGLSSVLSGTCQSARIAKEMCDYDKIHIVDSLSATAGMELLVRVACDMRDKGEDAAAIAEKITALVPKVRLFAVVDTLKYLVRGGRLSKAAGLIGGALGVKPLITVADGSVVSIGTARGQKGAFDKLANIVEEADIETSLPVILTYTESQENMHMFEAYLMEKGMKFDWIYSEVGSVIGTHVGPGAYAAVYFVK